MHVYCLLLEKHEIKLTYWRDYLFSIYYSYLFDLCEKKKIEIDNISYGNTVEVR